MEMLPVGVGKTWQGTADVRDALGPRRVAIVVSRYNETVTGRMLDGALFALTAGGVPRERIDVAWVPGAFELPLAADRLASSGGFAAVLCLGAIIRGETSHDRHIASAVGQGIEQTARRHGLPVPFGVLTCDTLAQAIARAAGSPADAFVGNKGAECATAALEMISLLSMVAANAPANPTP